MVKHKKTGLLLSGHGLHSEGQIFQTPASAKAAITRGANNITDLESGELVERRDLVVAKYELTECEENLKLKPQGDTEIPPEELTIKEMKSLLKAKDEDSLRLVCDHLGKESQDDNLWGKVFNKTAICQLLGTWDAKVWDLLATSFSNEGRLYTILLEDATKRLNSSSSDINVHNRISFFCFSILSEGSENAAQLVKEAKTEGNFLRLNLADMGYPEPSNNAVATAFDSLAKHVGKLEIRNITDLPVKAAESLSRHEGALHLDHLYSLSAAAAEALSKHKGDLLLEHLAKCSDSVLESLSKLDGKINGRHPKQWVESVKKEILEYHTIDTQAAKKFMEGSVDLSYDFIAITDAAAELLSEFKGDELVLDGLSKLSDAAAKSLSKYQGELSLRGLTEICSPSLAASLVRYSEDLSLDGLTSLSPEIAMELSRQKCESEGFEPCLRLEGLTELSQETTKVLMGHSGHLSLGLESVTIEQARMFLEFNGESLMLTDVSEVSDEVAEILSRSSADEICLEGLESLSPEAAQHLQKHECVKTLFDLDAIASSNDGEDEGEIIAFEGDGLTVSYTTS
ncbi:hypothetical protein N9150_02900 [Akkermansiaceae bacterium]|nr:hypothetical protein [Akkermansiaceae bacterium]